MLSEENEEDKYIKLVQMKLNKLMQTLAKWKVFKLA
jgi:hypothetical protein